MSIFSGLFRSRDKPQNSTAGSSYSFFMGGSTAGKSVTERSAMQMTAVYSCVRILAEAVAGLPLHLYRYTEEGGKEKNEKDEKKEDLLWKIMLGATVAFAIAFSVVLFMLLPYFLSGFLRKFGLSEVLVHLCEAVLRLLIFLIYMLLISRMKDIQRVFGYHGAEHKCINCIEHNLELNVENVMKSSRQHKRCGTSFLLIVVVISIIAFLILGLFGIQSRLWRLLWRLILIPVIAGISFELLRYAGCHEGPVINVLVKPGLALQKLVTREPDEKMCEVAIAAVNALFDWKEWQEQNR